MDDRKAVIGENLKRIRARTGYTLQDVERLSNEELKNAYLSQLENCHRTMSLEMLLKICEFYKVTPNEILGYDISWIEKLPQHLRNFVESEECVPYLELSENLRNKGILPSTVQNLLQLLLQDAMARVELNRNLSDNVKKGLK